MIGVWLDEYLRRMNNKFNAGNMTPEKYEIVKKFVETRKVDTVEKFKKYEVLSELEKKEYNRHFEELRTKLWMIFDKIARGRMARMGLHNKFADHIDDMATDAVLTIFHYVNRYDASRKTSAFAYVTQLAYNSIVASINDITTRNTTFVSGLDFFENINTIDNPTAAFTAVHKYIKALE